MKFLKKIFGLLSFVLLVSCGANHQGLNSPQAKEKSSSAKALEASFKKKKTEGFFKIHCQHQTSSEKNYKVLVAFNKEETLATVKVWQDLGRTRQGAQKNTLRRLANLRALSVEEAPDGGLKFYSQEADENTPFSQKSILTGLRLAEVNVLDSGEKDYVSSHQTLSNAENEGLVIDHAESIVELSADGQTLTIHQERLPERIAVPELITGCDG